MVQSKTFGITCAVACVVVPTAMVPAESPSIAAARRGWFHEARFGLFIHWGIPVRPDREWEQIPQVGPRGNEPLWYRARGQVRRADYVKLASLFNPSRFDADAWAKLAAEAGCKYLVFTAKHHDGFAMFDTKVSDFDVMDATPFGRDIVGELAEACRRTGVRFCVYYSHAQDWHEPDGGGNRWEYDEDAKDFDRYLEQKARPQVRELLTHYGPIGLVWFDTPVHMTPSRAESFVKLVHELQPECLVNSRVGPAGGEFPPDYLSMGDNQYPASRIDQPWETGSTLCSVWSFRENEKGWKPVGELIRYLVGNVSKGGNYLLNIGPDWEGVMPAEGARRLREIGRWLRANGDAIYGADAGPFGGEFPWGTATRKGCRLFLHVLNWPGGRPLVVYGLKTSVKRAALLADGTVLAHSQERDPASDLHSLRIDLPEKAPDPYDSVIALELDGEASADTLPMQWPDGVLFLEAGRAKLWPRARRSRLGLNDRDGGVEGWLDADDEVSWEGRLFEPGRYDVTLYTNPRMRKIGDRREFEWEGGHEVTLTIGDQALRGTIREDKRVRPLTGVGVDWLATKIGTIALDKPGMLSVRIQAQTIVKQKGLGFTLRAVRLEPLQR